MGILNKYIILFLAILILIIGCTNEKSFSNLDEFEEYVYSDESPYLKKIVKNGIKMSLLYMPTEVMMIRHYRRYSEEKERIISDSLLGEREKRTSLSQLVDKLEKNRKKCENSIYYKLTVGFEDESRDIIYESMKMGYTNYSEWLQKLLFSLKTNVFFENSIIREVPLSAYHMERSFGITKSRNILLAFPKEFSKTNLLSNDVDKMKIHIKEFGLNVGSVEFVFDLPLKKIVCEINN